MSKSNSEYRREASDLITLEDFDAEINKNIERISEFGRKRTAKGIFISKRYERMTIMTSVLFGITLGMIHMIREQKGFEGKSGASYLREMFKKIEKGLGMEDGV